MDREAPQVLDLRPVSPLAAAGANWGDDSGAHLIRQVEVRRTTVGKGGGACCSDLKTRGVGVPGRREGEESEGEGPAHVHVERSPAPSPGEEEINLVPQRDQDVALVVLAVSVLALAGQRTNGPS